MSHRKATRTTQVPPSLDLYTVTETAAILNVSKRSVFKWIKQEALHVIRLGPGQRLIRVRRADLEEFIDTQEFKSPTHGGSHAST
ncbi:MAG: helix-turn-helix domain-containing protein [Chloroflexota bacterium]|nr:helix-turn-helix domain-containing protein [Chloroflexota bacterium]